MSRKKRKERLLGGHANDVFRTIDLENSEKQLVVKQYQERKGLPHPFTRLINERTGLEVFEGSEAYPPRYYNSDEDDLTLIMEFVEGRMLGELLFTKLPKETRSLFFEWGRIMKSIHVPVTATVEHYVNLYLNDFEQNVKANYGLLKTYGIHHQNIEHLLVDTINSQNVQDAGVTRIHRDLYFANILVSENDQLRVIDWEFSGIGLPAEDFGIAFYAIDLAKLWTQTSIDAFWEGYGHKPEEEMMLHFFIGQAMKWLAKVNGTNIEKSGISQGTKGFLMQLINILKQVT